MFSSLLYFSSSSILFLFFSVSVLVLLLCIAAQSASTARHVLRDVLGLSVLTISISIISLTIFGTLGVYFMQLIGKYVRTCRLFVICTSCMHVRLNE